MEVDLKYLLSGYRKYTKTTQRELAKVYLHCTGDGNIQTTIRTFTK